MKKNLLIVTLLVATLGLPHALAAQPGSRDSIWIENKKAIYQQGVIDINMSFPQLDSEKGTEEILTTVNRAVLATLTNNPPIEYSAPVVSLPDLRLFIAKMASGINKKESQPMDPTPFQYFTSWSAFGNNLVFSIFVKTYTYLGGAHGTTQGSYLNFSKQTGEPIDIQSLIADTAKLMDMAAVYFCKERHLPQDAMQLRTGLFMELLDLPMPKQIGFGAKGLVLYYNQYEIAPYSSGQITITIPYSEMDHVLGPDCSKSQLTSGGVRAFDANTKRVNTALWRR
ncbi:MAG: DUF3298 domain-containing protein [Mucinivorans sp.]